MTQLKLSRVAAALAPVLAGMTLALNTHAADPQQRNTQTQSLGAQHGQSAEAQQQMEDARASRLIGMAVEGTDGKRLGDIEDLVIDLNNQRVHYAILGHGGIAGIGEKLFAYPISALQPAENDRVRINVTAEQLKDAPGFDRKNWPDWNNEQVRSNVDRYYGDVQPVKPDENPRYVRASDFIGKDIKDSANQDVGEVEDVIVNMKDGSLHYVLVDFDDWHENNNNRLFALSPDTFRAAVGDKDDLRIDAERQTLASAPSVDEKQLRNTRDQSWMADLKRHFGDSGTSMRGAVGGTPSSDALTEGSPGGRAQADRAPMSPTDPGGGDRSSGQPSTLPQPADQR